VPRRSLVLALALAAGCAPRASSGSGRPLGATVSVGEAQVRVLYWPEDARAARQVSRALQVAIPRTARWGGLVEPVTITIHPTHAALEEAVRRPGYAWLRAWARYATIDLQSPSTWSWLGASDARLTELLTHELTHCVMYQRASSDVKWSLKGIPLWFREGMASHTAGQGYRRGSLEDLWRFYQLGLPGAGDGERQPGAVARAARGRSPEGDPLGDAELLYQDRAEVVYGAAHHAFTFLLDRYGEASVHDLLARMRADASFSRAFKETYGIEEGELVADFRRYVVWEGWRR
jgi:hypothetical protein